EVASLNHVLSFFQRLAHFGTDSVLGGVSRSSQHGADCEDRNHLAGHGQGGQSKYQSFQSSHEKSRFRIDQRTVKQQPLSHVGEKEKEQLSELLTNNTNIGHTEALRRGQYVGYHIVTCKLVGLEM